MSVEQRCFRLIAEMGLEPDAADVRLLGSVIAGYWDRASRGGLDQLGPAAGRRSRRYTAHPGQVTAST